MDVCSWCGNDVDRDEGYRAAEPVSEKRAAFCRLEHVVPWILQGPHWEPGRIAGADSDAALGVCAQCGEDVSDTRVLLVRHRGDHRIGDAFCSIEHLLDWSKRGGRWRTGV